MTDKICNDYGDPGAPNCLKIADEKYTMDFTDVKSGGYLYWCSNCGPIARAMEAAITDAAETRPGFIEEFAAAIDKAEAEVCKH